MPLPPLTKDYVTVGGTQAALDTLWTWGQVRTPVYAAPHTEVNYNSWVNVGHAIDYIIGVLGIEAVESGDRLFRGHPFGAIGYNDWSTPNPNPPFNNFYRFYYGGVYESPPGSGIYVPAIGSGLDSEEQATILGGATVVGSGTTITTAADSYDGSDPDGQNIGTTALGTVSSVTLSF